MRMRPAGPRSRPGSPAPAPAPVGIDVTGTWQWTANCALVVRVTGWTSVTRRADGGYSASAGNSLGVRATGSGTLSGSVLTLRMSWSNGIKETATMYISGNSFTSKSTTGCTGSGYR